MNVRETIKKSIIHSNLYISDFFTRVKGLEQNIKVDELLKHIQNIDSIMEYDEFIASIRRYVPHGIQLIKRCYGGESLLYGHLSALYSYANYDSLPNIRAFPKLEHGIDTYESHFNKNDIAFVPNFIFQGDYKAKQIHDVNPLKPVFVVGPYIHYAKSYYSEIDLKKIKKKLGKTLLVFPFHCYEFSTAKYDDSKFVEYVMGRVAKDFESVLVSVYWNDVDDPIYEKFKIMGAKLVSSGFRGDQKFINRQKSLFLLSDAVCGNSYGTQIGYAKCLNKPYLYVDSSLSFFDTKHSRSKSEHLHYGEVDSEFKRAFATFTPDEEMVKRQETLYFRYWGGDAVIKSPEEMMAIIKLGELIFINSMGFKRRFDETVTSMLDSNSLPKQMAEQLKISLKHEI